MIKLQRSWPPMDVLVRALSSGEYQLRDAINNPMKHSPVITTKYKTHGSYVEKLSLRIKSMSTPSSREERIDLEAKTHNCSAYYNIHEKALPWFSRRFIDKTSASADPLLKSNTEKIQQRDLAVSKLREPLEAIHALKGTPTLYTRREKELEYLSEYYMFDPEREDVLLTFHKAVKTIATDAGFSSFSDLQFNSSCASLFSDSYNARAFLQESFIELEPLLTLDYFDARRWKRSNQAYKKYQNVVYPECINRQRRLLQKSLWLSQHINIVNSVVPGDLFLCLRKFCEVSLGITFDVVPLKKSELPSAGRNNVKLKVRDLDDSNDLGYIYFSYVSDDKLGDDASEVYHKTRISLPVARMRTRSKSNQRWSFREAKGVMHEFGHCLHFLLSAKGNTFNVSRAYSPDVLEMPSILLEMFLSHPLFIENIRDPEGASTKNTTRSSYLDTMVEYSALEMSDRIRQSLYSLEFFSRPDLESTTDIVKDIKPFTILDDFTGSARHQHELQGMETYQSQFYAYEAAQATANIVFFSLFDRNPFDDNSGRRLKKFLSDDWTKGIYPLLSGLVGRDVKQQDLSRALANPFLHKRKSYQSLTPHRL